jgi:drug/metabolite transporter (DMT)-like permease
MGLFDYVRMYPMVGSERRKGIISLISLTITWGVISLLPRYLSTSFQLFQQVYLRMMAGFIFSFVFFYRNIDFKKLVKLPLREWTLLALRACFYYLLGVVLYTQALLLTKISNVHFIGAIPMTAILGFVLLKERFTFNKLLLVILSFLGVILISVQDLFHLFVFGKGEVVALLSAFFICLGLISRKWQSEVLNDREVSTLILLFAAVFIFVASLFKGEGPPTANWNLGVATVLLLSGLLNTGISFFMNYGFARVDAVLANNILAMDPVFATLFAFLVYQELPIAREVFGGGLIVLSAILTHRLEANQKGVAKHKPGEDN